MTYDEAIAYRNSLPDPENWEIVRDSSNWRLFALLQRR